MRPIVRIFITLGMAYLKAKQPMLARRQLEQVLKLDPDHREAAQVKKQFNGLKS